MKIPFYLFAPFFIAGWVLVCFVLSRMGWIHFARKYGTSEEFKGKRLGAIVGRINGIGYKNVPVIYYSTGFIYIKAALMFRLFHPPFKVPITSFRLRMWSGAFGIKHYELILDDVAEAYMRLDKKQGIELHDFLVKHQLERLIIDKTGN